MQVNTCVTSSVPRWLLGLGWSATIYAGRQGGLGVLDAPAASPDRPGPRREQRSGPCSRLRQRLL